MTDLFTSGSDLEKVLVSRDRHVLDLLDQLQEDWLFKVAKDPHVLKHKPASIYFKMIILQEMQNLSCCGSASTPAS